MRHRQLGASGLRVSVLALGTMTFGGKGGSASVGSTGVGEPGPDGSRLLSGWDEPPADLTLLGPHLDG
jgi:hypothetical protein